MKRASHALAAYLAITIAAVVPMIPPSRSCPPSHALTLFDTWSDASSTRARSPRGNMRTNELTIALDSSSR